MKKRLRKKRHLKEFAQCGFEINADLNINPPLTNQTFSEKDADFIMGIWDKIIEFLENRNLGCGGGSSATDITIIVEKIGEQTSKFTSRPTRKDRDEVVSFILSLKELKNVTVGPLIDLWYENKTHEFKDK